MSMKKFFLFLLAGFLGTVTLSAQDRPWSLTLQGGLSGSGSENSRIFFKNDRMQELIAPQGGVSAGYDFTDRLGARVSLSTGRNTGIGRDSGGFSAYSFQSLNVFADAMWRLAPGWTAFIPKVYGGVGAARSFHFKNTEGILDPVKSSNTVPGARVGLNGEYRIFAGIGIVGDLCVEAYTDAYNGFVAGQRPFDLRALGSVGIIVHL